MEIMKVRYVECLGAILDKCAFIMRICNCPKDVQKLILYKRIFEVEQLRTALDSIGDWIDFEDMMEEMEL